jgi:sporulation protein YqfC
MNRKKKKNSPKGENEAALRRTEQLIDSLKLPKDMLLGASILTVTGNFELWVENYKGIIEYTQESIILQGKTGQISISGCGLVIDYYTNEDMKIIGNIRCISYL